MVRPGSDPMHQPGSPARGLARNPPSSPPPPPSPPPLPPQPPPPPMQPLASLTERSAFESVLGGVYEKSAWVASRTFDKGPFSSLSALATAMRETVDSATEEEKLALLCAHPDLAGKAALAGELTPESTSEQARAGLSSLTAEELEGFTALNSKYREKFGFPFILAVRNARKSTILAAFPPRLAKTRGEEMAAALAQVHKIAWMRMRDIVAAAPTGKLTCHVLDTARGIPAAGMTIVLRKRVVQESGEEAWKVVGNFVTNSDGRLNGPALQGEAFTEGVYEWTFSVGDYFAAAGVPTPGTPFLSDVPLRFGIDNPEQHYHVPLLCSPWSYSTYRGS